MARGLAVNDDDTIVIAGSFFDAIDLDQRLESAGQDDIFIAKLDADGQPLWSVRFGDESRQDVFDVTVDPCGNVLVFGLFDGTLSVGSDSLSASHEDEMFVMKLDESGGGIYAKSFSSSLQAGLVGPAIAADPLGDFVVAGHFEGSVDFGSGQTLTTTTRHAFLTRFSP
jgi:hypothetical protein